MYPLQRQAVQVSQHSRDVGPEDAQLRLPLVFPRLCIRLFVLATLLVPVPHKRGYDGAGAARGPALCGAVGNQGVDVGSRRFLEDTLGYPEEDLASQRRHGDLEDGGELLQTPLLLLLVLEDNGSMDGPDNKLNLLSSLRNKKDKIEGKI